MAYVAQFDVVGLGANLENGKIVAEGGWGVASTVNAAIQLKASKVLKDAKVVVELRGITETKWTGSKPMEAHDKAPARVAKRFLQMVEVVRDKKEALQPNEFGVITLPFKIDLPKSGLPSSYEDRAGSISYYFKATLAYQDGMKLLKAHREVEVPLYIRMPESARQRLLSTASPLSHNAPFSSEKCSYTINVPTRTLQPGECLTADVAITSTPDGASIRLVNASLRSVIEYTGSERASQVKFPRPLSEAAESVGVPIPPGSQPWSRRFSLLVDPSIAKASCESPLISIKTFFRFEIVLDTSEVPNVAVEVPVVVVPMLHDPNRSEGSSKSNSQPSPPTQYPTPNSLTGSPALHPVQQPPQHPPPQPPQPQPIPYAQSEVGYVSSQPANQYAGSDVGGGYSYAQSDIGVGGGGGYHQQQHAANQQNQQHLQHQYNQQVAQIQQIQQQQQQGVYNPQQQQLLQFYQQQMNMFAAMLQQNEQMTRREQQVQQREQQQAMVSRSMSERQPRGVQQQPQQQPLNRIPPPQMSQQQTSSLQMSPQQPQQEGVGMRRSATSAAGIPPRSPRAIRDGIPAGGYGEQRRKPSKESMGGRRPSKDEWGVLPSPALRRPSKDEWGVLPSPALSAKSGSNEAVDMPEVNVDTMPRLTDDRLMQLENLSKNAVQPYDPTRSPSFRPVNRSGSEQKLQSLLTRLAPVGATEAPRGVTALDKMDALLNSLNEMTGSPTSAQQPPFPGSQGGDVPISPTSPASVLGIGSTSPGKRPSLKDPKRYRVIGDYMPQMGDEVDLRVGQVVVIK
ncbi:hypothetical protein HK101_005416 [Irineochytrium annulatum]|nr:hypothetical protein HK101_005416 [Irineochytrium annulatum]